MSGAGGGVGLGSASPDAHATLDLAGDMARWSAALLSLQAEAAAGVDPSQPQAAETASSKLPLQAGVIAPPPAASNPGVVTLDTAAPTSQAGIGTQLAGSADAVATPATTKVPVAAAGDSALLASAGRTPTLPSALASLLTAAGYAQRAAIPASDAPRNPLLDWARNSTGPTASAELLAASATLPGPLSSLLARGTDPAVALTLQIGWEAALLGGREPISGSIMPSLAQSWGLPDPAALSALLSDLGVHVNLPDANTARPSAQLATLVGAAALPSAALPSAALVAAFAARSTASALLLGYDGKQSAGIGLAGFAPFTGIGGPAPAGFVAVRLPSGDVLLLARHGPAGLPAISDGIALGGATLRSGEAASQPWVAADATRATVPEVASWLPPVLLAALPASPAVIAAATVTIPFGLAPSGQRPTGQIVLADGRTMQFGDPADALLLQSLGSGDGARSALRIGTTRPGFSGGENVATYGERRRLPIDLAPAALDARCWRLDDTCALVEVNRGNAGSAALRAAELYGSLQSNPGLALVQPGEGFSTWPGSPLWLALAGIGKPARLGVLPFESAPGRIEVLRTNEGEWLVEHAGGARPAPLRTRHDRHALEQEALLLDVLWGIDDPASPHLALWSAARSTILLAARLSGAETAWRAQEAWAGIARAAAALPTDTLQAEPARRALVLRAAFAGSLASATSFTLEAALASGDPDRVRAALPAHGRTALARLLAGETGGIDPEIAVALAACLGRLEPSPVTTTHISFEAKDFLSLAGLQPSPAHVRVRGPNLGPDATRQSDRGRVSHG